MISPERRMLRLSLWSVLTGLGLAVSATASLFSTGIADLVGSVGLIVASLGLIGSCYQSARCSQALRDRSRQASGMGQ